ncbi:unnamed protein product [Amoebophrya sp. A120]|nr:unnamed protein product [Amoebophrya sp. A120]|eukprot:GSA120T00005475001.1
MSSADDIKFETVFSGEGWEKPQAAGTVVLKLYQPNSAIPTAYYEYALSTHKIATSLAFTADDAACELPSSIATCFQVKEDGTCGIGEKFSAYLQTCAIGEEFRVTSNCATTSGGNNGGPADSEAVVVSLESITAKQPVESVPAVLSPGANGLEKFVAKPPKSRLNNQTPDGAVVSVRVRTSINSPWTEFKEVTLGDGSMPDLVELAVASMREGERSYLTAPLALCPLFRKNAYGEQHYDLEKAMKEAPYFAVALDTVSAPNLARDWKTLAPARKDIGAKLLQEKPIPRILLARRIFEQTARLVRQEVNVTGASGSAGSEEFQKLYRACLSNMALADLKLAEGGPLGVVAKSPPCLFFATSAVTTCNELLESEPTNQKAIYRRALANEILGEEAEAMKDAKAILADDPKNKDFLVLAHRLKDAKSRGGSKGSKLSSKMFGGGDGDQRTAEARARQQETANMNPMDEKMPPGISPMDVARRQGHGEIVNILEEHQAKQAKEKEARHEERRQAGCLNSDTEDEDGEDRFKLKRYREAQNKK